MHCNQHCEFDKMIVLIVKEDEKKWMALGDTSYLLMKLNVPQAIYVVLTLVSISGRIILQWAESQGKFEALRLFHQFSRFQLMKTHHQL